MKKNVLDMTVGKPEKLILSFAVPLFIGNLFQQLFIVFDTMIVGHLLGDHALAAIGSTSSIYFLLITFLTGSSSGFSMILARYFGAKDEEGLKKATGASVFLALLMTAVLTLIGIFMARPILTLLNTPDYIIPDAHAYLQILFATMGLTVAFNTTSGFLQALGNSRMPLYSLGFALTVNVLLSFWFVAPSGLNLGVAAAAWATVLSQGLAASINLFFIVKNVPELHIRWKHLKPDKPLLKEIFLLAASIGFGNSIIQFGSVILQFAINGFGVYTITAFTTARKVFGITFMPLMTTGIAVSTFTSQNLGAGKKDRIKSGLFAGVKITAIWSTLMVLMAYGAGEYIVGFMSGSHTPQVITEAAFYLRVTLPFLYALSVLVLYKALMQGMGHKKIPVITSVMELAGKVIATLWVIPRIGFLGIALTEPMIWVSCAILLILIVHKDALALPKFKKSKAV